MPDFRTIYHKVPSSVNEEEEQESRDVIVSAEKAERWNQVANLDTFFSRIYYYHSHSGYKCIALESIWNVIKFAFVVLWSAFVIYCVDYPMLFHDKNPDYSTHQNSSFVKITISDVVLPVNRWMDMFGFFSSILAFIVFCYFNIQVVNTVCTLINFIEIKKVFSKALKIPDEELVDIVWHEVQRRLLKCQKELHICVNSQKLTEIDIYHRILRFQNYMVAMVNKSVLPTKHNLPIFGEVIYFTEGIKLNIEYLLFLSRWSPFAKVWELNQDYKNLDKKVQNTNSLRRQITILAFINLALFPVIFFWRILHFIYEYTVKIKWDSSALSSRHWSISAQLYLRHFNELDHELNERLNRGHRYATRYMNSFTNPVTTVNAKSISALICPVMAVLILLGMYDEDVFQVQHLFGILSVLTVVFVVCNAAIPDKNKVRSPEWLLTSTLSEIHYMPYHWWGKGHTTQVRDEFAKLFPSTMSCLIKELISPIVCPLYLYFCLRPKASEIVDFFRLYTAEHFGTGDVCSFALLDIRKHGHPQRAGKERKMDASENAAEGGKAELSLMRFTMANPEWKPPHESTTSITQLNEHSNTDVIHDPVEEDPLLNQTSLMMANPEWKPPHESTTSITELNKQSNTDVIHDPVEEDPLLSQSSLRMVNLWKPPHESTTSITQLNEHSNTDVIHDPVEEDLLLSQSSLRSYHPDSSILFRSTNSVVSSIQTYETAPSRMDCLNMADSLLSDDFNILTPSMKAVDIHHLSQPSSISVNAYLKSPESFEGAARNMGLSALFLHMAHHKEFHNQPETGSHSSAEQINETFQK